MNYCGMNGVCDIHYVSSSSLSGIKGVTAFLHYYGWI